MTRSFPRDTTVRVLAIATLMSLGLVSMQNFNWAASAGTVGASSRTLLTTPPGPGIFYTVTGTADNTDVVIHGGTGTAADPFQMSSLRGAVLNGNTIITGAVGPVTISVPAGTYLLSVDNPNTPAVTGTVNFPDLEIGSTFNQDTRIIGTGGAPKIQQTVFGNDVITTGFQNDGFTPEAVTLRLENLEITGGSFSGIFTGVDNASGSSSTTIVNCNIHDNSDPFGSGGGIFNQTGNLTIDGSTFANNTASDQGGAIFYDLPNSNGSPGTFGNFIVTNSTFTNNSATAPNNVAGGAIVFFGPNRIENTYSVTGSNFVNNHANGANAKGGAIGSASSGTLHATLNRFFGNTAGGGGTGVAGQGATPIDAINNWWGCDDFPGATGCDTANGSGVTSNPRLDLVLTSVPGCSSTTLTADFSKNSANQSVAPTVLNGLTVFFAVVSGPPGSMVSPPSATISGFMASSTLTASSGGTATVSATLDNGTQTASAEIDKAVAVTTNPTDQSVCDGGTATFTAAASGNPTPTVQWQVSTNGGGSFSDIPGATNPILSFTATAAQNGNQYRAVFSNTCDATTQTATTTAATLTVNTAPTVTTNPTNQTVCEGASASFTAAANGSPAPTVQWQVSTNGGGSFSNIPGATNTTLTFTAATSQNGNQYRAVFTNACSPAATTTAATLTVNANTTATMPADQTVCQGATANFSTTASGTGPFSYQWSLDGTPISGATNSSVSIDTTSLSTTAHSVSVTVTGTCGSVTKNATLTVNANTTATTPADQTVCQGATASFSTTASGTNLHYAWTVDGSSFNGDSPSINVPTGSMTVGSHPVTVTVSGTCGNVTKNATLTVQENTSATTPADQTVCQGATAGFSTTASGTGPFHYAWTVDGSSFNGDSPSINVPTGSMTVGSHPVTVTVSGTCGNVTKNATLTVQENTSATTPADQTVCQGATANFSTTASGTGPFTYQWSLDGTPISGATNSSVSIDTTSLSTTAHSVSVAVSGTCGGVTKNATLTVNANTTATTPADQTVCQGATAGFSTTASGTNIHYAWTVDGSSFNGDSPSINVPTGSMTVGNHPVTVTVSGTCGIITRNATLTVQANTSATTPNDQTVCKGATAGFSTTASGTGPFHYAWTVDGSPFNGDSSSISVPTGSMTVGSHPVTVTVTGGCGSVTKNATLTVQQNTATTKPNDQSVCQGSTASFSTTASGTGPFTFVWKKGATVLHTGDFGGRVTITSTSTTSTLTISNAQPGDAGSYTVETTGTCGTATQSANLTVNSSPPTITMDPNQQMSFWPPNHQYQTVRVTDFVLSASDSCDPSVDRSKVYITHITSDEAENGPGSGNTLNDIVIGADCKTAQLRAERETGGNGRVYTIYFKVKNSAGNFATATAKVTVPKSQNGSGAIDSGPHYTVTSGCP